MTFRLWRCFYSSSVSYDSYHGYESQVGPLKSFLWHQMLSSDLIVALVGLKRRLQSFYETLSANTPMLKENIPCAVKRCIESHHSFCCSHASYQSQTFVSERWLMEVVGQQRERRTDSQQEEKRTASIVSGARTGGEARLVLC